MSQCYYTATTNLITTTVNVTVRPYVLTPGTGQLEARQQMIV